MEWWSDGLVEKWSDGMVEYWSDGIPVRGSSELFPPILQYSTTPSLHHLITPLLLILYPV